MAVLLALDGDEAGREAAVRASAKIAAYFESWATPKSEGPTAQALAAAQATYDNAATRYSLLYALHEAEPTDDTATALREAEWLLDEIAIYMVDLFDEESQSTDRVFRSSKTADELAWNLTPHKRVDDIRRIDWARIKALDIVSLATDHGATLRQMGDKFKTNCLSIEHDDKNASMWLYTKTNSYYCWSCQSGGDTGDLIRAMGKDVRDF